MEIKHKCTRCRGTGTIDPYGDPPGTDCPDCEGDGMVEWGTSPDVINKLDDILNKCNDILDKLDE